MKKITILTFGVLIFSTASAQQSEAAVQPDAAKQTIKPTTAEPTKAQQKAAAVPLFDPYNPKGTVTEAERLQREKQIAEEKKLIEAMKARKDQ